MYNVNDCAGNHTIFNYIILSARKCFHAFIPQEMNKQAGKYCDRVFSKENGACIITDKSSRPFSTKMICGKDVFLCIIKL